ncbi:MAG: M1 family peptidase [Deltaproteobacteria bacterium]|nr:M1 family peptidase [Deltaproteobacteria bacterium]
MGSRTAARRPGASTIPAALFTLFLSATGAQGAPVIAHHDLSVTFLTETGVLAGTDTLTVRTGGASRLAFSLAAGARVTGVSAGGKALPFVFRDGTLSVPLPEGAGGDEAAVTVAYEAAFRDSVPDDPVNTEDPTYGVTGTISPRGVFLTSEAGWYPDIPGSRPTWRVRVTAAEGIEAVTAGKLVRRETSGGTAVSEWKVAHPLAGLALSAGPYRVREQEGGGTRIFTCFYPEDDPLSEKYLAAAARYLDLYRGLFGPYPFDKFAVVENFFPTGYGFPSYTLLGSTVVRLPFVTETSLGHEIAHSWWGNGVLVDSSRGNWSEGLTTYVADYYYKERISPEEGREYRVRLLREYASLVPPDKDFPLAAFASRVDPASRAVGYGKGAMVFHMARRLVGDKDFFRALRAVARDKIFKAASWEDFERALSREGQTDLAPFFRQWVERPGAPVLGLKDVKADRIGDQWRIEGRIVQEKPYYALQVPLRLETEGKAAEAVLPLDGPDVRFILSAGARTRRLLVDPEADLFRRLDPAEIPPTVDGIRGSTSLVVIVARSLPPETLEAAGILLKGLGREDIPVLREEEETSPERLRGHDVLYIGYPEGAGYLPPLPRALTASANGFILEGRIYDAPADALFAALPHPSDKDRISALFLPLSAEAATQTGRKIPHYGKYSYLSFSAGTNQVKGTWAVTVSPTVHEFAPEGGPAVSPR